MGPGDRVAGPGCGGLADLWCPGPPGPAGAPLSAGAGPIQPARGSTTLRAAQHALGLRAARGK